MAATAKGGSPQPLSQAGSGFETALLVALEMVTEPLSLMWRGVRFRREPTVDPEAFGHLWEKLGPNPSQVVGIDGKVGPDGGPEAQGGPEILKDRLIGVKISFGPENSENPIGATKPLSVYHILSPP